MRDTAGWICVVLAVIAGGIFINRTHVVERTRHGFPIYSNGGGYWGAAALGLGVLAVQLLGLSK